MPNMKNIPFENDYSDYDEGVSAHSPSKELGVKKIAIILLIIFVFLIILILAINLLSQKNNLLFFSGDGKSFNQTVSISKDGKLIDSAYFEGENLSIKANPLDSIRGKISSPSLVGGKKSGKITITGGNGRITILNSGEGFFIDEQGNVIFTIDPFDLLDLDEYYDENTGSYNFPEDFIYSTTFELIIIDEETGEEIIIVAPVDFIFSNTNANQCLALNRAFVNESTHYGSLPVGGTLNVICETYSDLTSSITWEGGRKGNVEISVNNGAYSTVLSDYNKPLLISPTTGDYPFKIIFTPLKEAAGEKAYFSVNFNLNGFTSKIDFEVPIDNLEQCVQISSEDLFLKKESDSVSFKIDASTCHSDRINISLCDNDLECAGGTIGGINLSQYSFVLNPKGNSSKTISISKKEIPGAYGIPIYARISGASKVFVDEKIVIIEPFNGEPIFPEKFIISILGATKDSVQIRNNDLAEDVEVNASICDLYKNSLGVKVGEKVSGYTMQTAFGNSWWRSLSIDSDKYSGRGKYQSALFSLIGDIEQKRIDTQNASYSKNATIKQAYLLTDDLVNKIDTSVDEIDEMLMDLKNLDDKINSANEYADLDLTSKIVSLSTGATTIFTSASFLSADVTAASTAVDTASLTGLACPASNASTTTAVASMKKAMSAASSLLGYSSTVLGIATATYGVYTGMDDLTKNVESINSASALSNTTKALEKLNAAKDEAKITLMFAELMMISASIDKFYSISKEDLTAKEYAEDVLSHAQNVLDLLTQSQKYLTDALDDITIGLPDTQSNAGQIVSIAASIASLITQLPMMEANASEVISEINIAAIAMTTAVGAATTACDVPATSALCCPVVAPGKIAIAKLEATNLTGISTLSSVTSYLSLLNTVYGLVRTYQTMTDNYVEDYANSSTKLSELIPLVNTSKIAAQALVDYLPTTINSAEWLEKNSLKTSEISSYSSEEYGIIGEEYNKKRMNGIIGTILGNAFVNGAYLGGVYSKESVFSLSKKTNEEVSSDKNKLHFAVGSDWLEDCANRVTLTLPDYKINILRDAQKPIVSNSGVVAVWDFSNPKVYGVFEEQTVDLIFSNNGLTKNIYGILELPVTKHIHKNPTEVTGKFGPFDVPDTSESVTYKYHMKFNSVPRKSNNYTKFTGENSCTVGILRGETKSVTSTPRVILSWDWNSVTLADNSQILNNSNYSRKINSAVIGSNSELEPFIDATQLSILLSKKLGSLDYYLETALAECPKNPVENIINEVAPLIENTMAESYSSSEGVVQKCYLPLSTEEYDGKPALYYYLPEKTIDTGDIFSIEDKIDIQKVRDREEFLTLVDFNAFLIRDGYGIDFQSDFVASFSSKAFNAAYSFMNKDTGLRTYFYNTDRFFFSSKANMLNSKNEWTIPDAGKYRIRLLIDFDNSARLFLGGSPSAEIIVLIDLIEPIDNDYSPWYYTPIDGFTGLSANNNRRGYGSSLLGGYNLDVVKSQGALISTEQKNSLAKIKFVRSNDFFLLNALPSMRSKILDYSLSPLLDNTSTIVFTPTVATPLLFEIKETVGEKFILNYKIKRENMDISTKMNSSFILSKLGGCADYTGVEGSSFINNGPDVGDGKVFGAFLPVSTRDGFSYVKTVAYAPTSGSYFLEKPESLGVYSPYTLGLTGSAVMLVGVPSMKSNYYQNSELVDSLEQIFLGIESGSICVARLGTREIFFWPEEQMFDQKYVGTELTQRIDDATNKCLK